MLFNELRKHGKLAAKRHPMYDKNRFGKYAMYAMAVFWAAYLIFFGTTFAFAFDTNSMEPYHIMNSGICPCTRFHIALSATKDPDTGGKTLPPDAGQAEQGN